MNIHEMAGKEFKVSQEKKLGMIKDLKLGMIKDLKLGSSREHIKWI